MSKKNVTLIVTVLVLGTISVVFWVLSYGPLAKTFPIYSDISNVQEYPEIKWEDVISGKLQRFLNKSRKEGKLSQLTETAQPVNGFQGTGEGLYQEMSIRYVQLSNDDIKSKKYADISKRPYHFVAFYRTKITNNSYLLLIQEWLNSDGSMSYVPLIMPEDKAIIEQRLTDYYKEAVFENTEFFLSPIMQYRSVQTCKSTHGMDNGYCDWYFARSSQVAKYEKMMGAWITNGIVPVELGKYPVMFTVSSVGSAIK